MLKVVRFPPFIKGRLRGGSALPLLRVAGEIEGKISQY
ncbi:hypothetical protein O53_1115 [Microcystis aeruginosa TAIHU98]|uniref:Uncharacterized protein n=1 Tax=Microcystis aeruginosa TAIHU98 TaxID=1134457 RepID=L7ECU4_MICAE|nr:hypothetical protein O53_1115 [Microcystis aeruginosa TAIHU98]ODV37187.1 hypothetical protein BFG60_3329 [Microcystis aeruginosa NIES-98]